MLAFKNAVESRFKEDILEVINTYNSLTFFLKGVDQQEFISFIQRIEEKDFEHITVDSKRWIIPVCYDPSMGLDLEKMAVNLELDMNEIIQIHSDAEYLLYFIGFLPGFMYLGGLDDRLFHPRKSMPRTKISKGDVGIAGEQTGIYPIDSPGGWNIVGNTPIPLFDSELAIPCFAQPGDSIRFQSISLEEYDYLQEEITRQKFDVNSLMKNGQGD